MRIFQKKSYHLEMTTEEEALDVLILNQETILPKTTIKEDETELF